MWKPFLIMDIAKIPRKDVFHTNDREDRYG